MREDMHKLLCLRPRINSAHRYKDKYSYPQRDWKTKSFREDWDALEGHEAMRIGNTKAFGEYLQPLERWLHSQVGRPWDHIYSDFRKVITNDGAVRAHALQHFKYMYQARVRIENGKVCHPRYGELSNEDLYLDPETKILCKYKKAKTSAPVQPSRIIRLENHLFLIKEKGIWFKVEYNRPVSRDDFRWDHFFDTTFGHPEFIALETKSRTTSKWKRDDFGVAHLVQEVNPRYLSFHKKQLSKKELKSYGVQNGD